MKVYEPIEENTSNFEAVQKDLEASCARIEQRSVREHARAEVQYST